MRLLFLLHFSLGNDYTTDKYIKNSGKLTINSNTTNNVIQIENSTGNFQFNKEGANFYIRNNTGNAVLEMDNSTRLVNVFNNLTISGTLQSFQTSLLATSSSVMDGKLGTNIGVSIPQALTRNETNIPSSFSNYILNDNLIFNSRSNTNSYIQFQNNNSVNNSFYIGKVGASDLVLNTTGAMIFKRQGTENSRIDNSGNWIINNNLTISGTLQCFQTFLLATSSVMDGRIGTIIGVSIPQFL